MDTAGNGPCSRFSARNHTASSSAPTDSAAPPTASARAGPGARTCVRTRAPISQPTTLPMAIPASRMPRTIAERVRGSEENRVAYRAARAPTEMPMITPPSPNPWSKAPRR